MKQKSNIKKYLSNIHIQIHPKDISASIVVFLVALPLCLGIAIASGAPPIAGIISGIIGGVVVGLISNSALGVSGPAAGLVAICIAAIAELGGYSNFLVAVMMAGVIQVILGLIKAGKISYFFPSSVIKGMLVSIGIIIIMKQIPHAFGYDRDFEGDLAFQQPDHQNTFSEILNMWKYVHPASTVIFLSGLIVFFVWTLWIEKQFKRVAQIIQAPLAIVIMGIIWVKYIQMYTPFHLSIETEHLVNIPTLQEIKNDFRYPEWKALSNPELWYYAFIIAFVASIETLLCVEATDVLDPQKRNTSRNRELIAQGIGNFLSGILGGLPITQVIVRSSANINFGAQTKWSAILHGTWLLLSIMFIRDILNAIPLAALATILILIGYKLAQPSIFKKTYSNGWKDFLPFIITIITILFTDLLIGVLVGLLVSIVIQFYVNSSSAIKVETNNNVMVVKIHESASFLNKTKLNEIFYSISGTNYVKVVYNGTDLDILEIIHHQKNILNKKNITLNFITNKTSITNKT